MKDGGEKGEEVFSRNLVGLSSGVTAVGDEEVTVGDFQEIEVGGVGDISLPVEVLLSIAGVEEELEGKSRFLGFGVLLGQGVNVIALGEAGLLTFGSLVFLDFEFGRDAGGAG